MADRASREEVLIAFTVKESCTVYIAIKKEDKDAPNWLAEWNKMDEPIIAADRMDLYRKSFDQGDTVELGSIQTSSMYTVAIQPDGGK